MILAGGVGGPLLLMFGLAHNDAASASLLLNLEGLATMGIAWVAFRENVDRRLLVGASAILAAPCCCPGRDAPARLGHPADRRGLPCWGIDNNLTRKLSSADPVQIAMVKGLVAGAVNLVLALAGGAYLPPAGRSSPPAGSASWATVSASRCSCWACAISARRGPGPTSRSRPSSARCSPC